MQESSEQEKKQLMKALELQRGEVQKLNEMNWSLEQENEDLNKQFFEFMNENKILLKQMKLRKTKNNEACLIIKR